MSNYANSKYEHYQRIWVEYDHMAFYLAMLVGVWSIIFHIVTNFGPKD
jgi:hypothetical protein